MLPPHTNAQPLGAQAEQQIADYSKEYIDGLKLKITKLESERDARVPGIFVAVAFILGLVSCDGAANHWNVSGRVLRAVASSIAPRDAPRP